MAETDDILARVVESHTHHLSIRGGKKSLGTVFDDLACHDGWVQIWREKILVTDSTPDPLNRSRAQAAHGGSTGRIVDPPPICGEHVMS